MPCLKLQTTKVSKIECQVFCGSDISSHGLHGLFTKACLRQLQKQQPKQRVKIQLEHANHVKDVTVSKVASVRIVVQKLSPHHPHRQHQHQPRLRYQNQQPKQRQPTNVFYVATDHLVVKGHL